VVSRNTATRVKVGKNSTLGTQTGRGQGGQSSVGFSGVGSMAGIERKDLVFVGHLQRRG
jgi:ribosomal protein L15